MNPINYNMGEIKIGGSPVTQPKTDIKAFNQSMVNAQPQTPTSNTFTGASVNNSWLNTSPTVVSNYNTPNKVFDITKKAEELTGQTFGKQPVLPQQQVQQQTQQQGIKDYTNAPYSTRDGQNYFYNDQTQAYDIPDVGSNTGLFAQDPYSLAMAKNIEDARKKNDSALASALEGIKNRFEQYRTTQKNVTGSGAAGAGNALLQSEGGNRGSVSQFAAATADRRVESIMADGQKALQELDNKERELVSATQSAFAQDDFKYVSQLNAQIEKLRTEKLEKSKKINDLLAAEQVKADTVAKQVEGENAVSEIFGTGITDPAQIQRALKERGITNMTLKDINDNVSLLSGLGGTGMIGEYNYYKSEAQRNGQVPVDFQTYQDMDANRKKLATTPSGLTTSQNASFLRITDKFQADPIINNAIKGQTAIAIADQVLANPAAAPNQLKALYSLVKNLDPDSAVREGEISLAQQTQSYYSTWKTALDRVSTGAVIAPETAAALANATKELATAWESTAKKRQKQYEAQASGAGIKDAFSEYLQTSDLPYATGNKIIESEQQAQKAFESLKNNPPAIQEEITNRYNDLQEVLGHPPTATEYFKYNPWDMPQTQAFNTVVGDTNLSQGVVGGINLKGYAVDPNQIKAVATLYNKVPDTSNAFDYDTFIKSVAPKSQIKGQDIIAAADVYNLDPKIILALMQHESRLGTSTVALTNNNFGGITWSPTYAKNNPGSMKGTPRPANEGGYYVKFATPLEGLMAQAKLLSNRKIA